MFNNISAIFMLHESTNNYDISYLILKIQFINNIDYAAVSLSERRVIL